MDKTKIGIAIVVWAVIVIVDLAAGFFGVWSLIGYAVLAAFIWILLSTGDHKTITGKPKPTSEDKYWVVYHGTEHLESAIRILKEGIKPGDRDVFGVGAYLTFYMEEARLYSLTGGVILRLYIEKNVKWIRWEDVPGFSPPAKRKWCMDNGYQLVFINEYKWFVVFGQKDLPVSIPGLAGVEVLDFHGNSININ